MNSSINQANEKPDMGGQVLRRLAQVFGQTFLIMAILLIAAGRWDWGWAWAYLGVGLAILAINALVVPPELIAERGKRKENVKRWDKVITSLMLIPALAIFVVAGLDERFGWSPDMSPAMHVVGLALVALSQGLFTWAMVSNKFFSTAVRIQVDRGHTVATGGTYRYVRHPGYAALIVFWFALAPAFGSLWALIPAGLNACLYIARTALEDKMLQKELEGYKEYAQRVRYRLLPGVW